MASDKKNRKKPTDPDQLPLFKEAGDQQTRPPVLLITAAEKEVIDKEDEGFQEILEARKNAGYFD